MKRDPSVTMGKILYLQVTIFVVFILSSFVFASQDPNLVGWWKFDEGAGDIAYDSSGYGNNFTLQVNPAYKDDPNYIIQNRFVEGLSGTAIQFDGSYDSAYVPHNDILKPHYQMSISLWLKADELTESCQIYYKGDGGSYGAAINQISIEGKPGSFTFRFTFSADRDRHRMDAPITEAEFADSQWHLYTCTYDGNDMKSYRDGLVIAQMHVPGEIGVCGNANIYLGSLTNCCAGVVHYNGLMDDLRIYDRALTQQEILEMAGATSKACDPDPGNGATFVDLDTTLTWTPSPEALGFDLYFGTDFQAVEDANNASPEFIANLPLDANSYDPNGLDAGTIYYWRVDEDNGNTIAKGQVWNFETAGDVDPNLIGWWKFDEESGNTAFDSSGNNNHAAIAGNPLRELGVIDNAAVFFGTNEFAQVGNESHFDLTSDLSISAWVKFSELDTSAMYIVSKSQSYFIFKDMDSDTLTFICENTGMPVMGSVNVVDGKWHHVVGVHDGSYNYLYVDGQLDIKQKAYFSPFANDNPLYIGNDAVWPDKEFNGSIDDARVYNKALTASEVMALAAVRFSVAHDPQPADKSVYVPVDKTLSFQPGNYALSHDIYFGTDYQAVFDANTSSHEYMGNQPGNTYSATLELNTTYYWRIDEVNDTNIWTGDVWSFTTTDEMPDPSLVGYWKLVTGYGYDVYDVSGNGNHGEILEESEWGRSNIGYILGIRNDDEAGVRIKNESPFDITDEITVATWIYNSAWERWDSSDSIISKGSTAWKLYRNGGWTGADSVRFNLSGVGYVTTAKTTMIANSKWHHLAGTYDGSTIKLYVDGKLDSSKAASGAIDTNNEKLWIGNDPVTGNDLGGGSLKEIRVYNRALDAAEIDVLATPKYASKPNPQHRANNISSDVTLSFRPGKKAESVNLYFGDNRYNVNHACVDSNEFVGNFAADANSYVLTGLEKRKFYYWRVDSVAGQTVTAGPVWFFYVPCDTGDLEADIDGNCSVNLIDYALMADTYTGLLKPVVAVTENLSNIYYSSTNDKIKISFNDLDVDISNNNEGLAQFYCYDSANLSEVGEPDLPWKVATILLPPDTDLATVSADFKEVVYKPVTGNWQVAPVRPDVFWDPENLKEVINWPENKNLVDGKDVGIYENNAFFPAEKLRNFDTGRMRKWKLTRVAVPLVRYNPATSQIERLAKADIEISFAKTLVTSQAAKILAKNDIKGQKRIADMVANFDQYAQEYQHSSDMAAMTVGAAIPGLDYIIMTTQRISENSTMLDDFIAHKQAMGYNVRVVDEDMIDDDDDETSESQEIRAWLQNNESADPNIVEYVLLIGNPEPGTNEFSMALMGSVPSDYYFADLSGDLYPEVLVGRIPCYFSNIPDLDAILAKTIKYESEFTNTMGWRTNTLIAMKPLNSYSGVVGGTSWWLGEQVKDDFLIPAGWPYHRIYDVNLSTDPEHLMPTPETWPCTDYSVTDTWSKDKYGLMMYTTHGAETSASGIMNLSLLPNLNDAYPSFICQCSCSTAYPENCRNLSYEFLKNGGICVVGNTRPSGYNPYEEDFNNNAGTCLAQSYQYVKRIVAGMTGGEALYDLKANQYTRTSNRNMLNLYGDASLKLLPPHPADFNGNGIFDFDDLAIISDEWLEDRN